MRSHGSGARRGCSSYRWLALACGVAVCGSASRVEASCDDPFADPDEVLDFHLRVEGGAWQALVDLDMSDCNTPKEWHAAQFRCGDDEPWIDIAVRRKRGRNRDVADKPPLKLDFNREVMAQRWPAALAESGFRRLTLADGQADINGSALSALLTEHVAWRLMNVEVPRSSRSAYARLNLYRGDDATPDYRGVYILIEDIDRTAIRRLFPDASGRLYKTTDPRCPENEVFDDGDPNPVADAFDDWVGKSPGDADEWEAETRAVIDVEEVMRQEALRDVLGNQDDSIFGDPLGGSGIPNNFFSFDPTMGDGLRHFLPWDLDDVFRPWPYREYDGNFPPDTQLSQTCSRVGQRIRCHSAFRERYREIMCQLVNGTLDAERILDRFASIDSWLRPIIEAEIDSVWSGSGWNPLDAGTEGTYAHGYQRYQQWIPDRIQSVRGQLADAGFDCPEGCSEGESENCDYLGCPSQRVCEDGLWTGCQPTACEPGSVSTATTSTSSAASGSGGTSAASASGASTSGGGGGSGAPPSTGTGGQSMVSPSSTTVGASDTASNGATGPTRGPQTTCSCRSAPGTPVAASGWGALFLATLLGWRRARVSRPRV